MRVDVGKHARVTLLEMYGCQCGEWKENISMLLKAGMLH